MTVIWDPVSQKAEEEDMAGIGGRTPGCFLILTNTLAHSRRELSPPRLNRCSERTTMIILLCPLCQYRTILWLTLSWIHVSGKCNFDLFESL